MRELRSGPTAVRQQFGGADAMPTDAKQCARWVGLGDASVCRHAAAVLNRISPPPTTGAVILGRGYLAWAAAHRLL
jgi:hypothetical protein